MEQYVAPAYEVEVVLHAAKRRRDFRPERLVLQVRSFERAELHKVSHPQRPFYDVDVRGREVERLGEVVAHLCRHVRRDFQAHGRPEAALSERLLDHAQEVVGLVFANLNVGVARHAERVALAHLHAREQRLDVGRDEFFEKDELRHLLADGHETRDERRDFNAREARLDFSRERARDA